MKYLIYLTWILLTVQSYPQETSYWKNAPTDGLKVYSIYLLNHQNVLAVSGTNEIFSSTDEGTSWQYEGNMGSEAADSSNIQWSADIYCAALQTSDGGVSWSPYTKEKQEHFCLIFLKDPNVGYQTAYEFLHKVTSKILNKIQNEDIISLIGKPQQCTEYYFNQEEGWALGWCLKNFKLKEGY